MSASQPFAGQEVLVVDNDASVVKGLDRLLGRAGLLVSGTADPVHARDLLVNKFFAVALVDHDTPTPGEGLELLQFARDKSPMTSIIVMTGRKSFDVVLRCFRGGAADVIVKDPETVPYLRERVIEAAGSIKASTERSALLEEVIEAHEDFFKRMRDLSKQLLDMEDRVLGRADGESDGLEVMSLVLVDDDPGAASRLERILSEKSGWRVRAAMTGGEALDVVTQWRPQVVIVKEQLPDLPGSMVVKTVKAAVSDAVTLLYSPPTRPGMLGEVKMVDQSRVMNLISGYAEPQQLLAPLAEIREGVRQKLKERRYLQAFRQRNFEFLQRWQGLKQRVSVALEATRKPTR